MTDEPLPYPDPPLSDGRIGLRRWREADVDCIRLAGTDPRIPKGTTVPATFTPVEGLAFIHRQWGRVENGEGVTQAIVEITSADSGTGLSRRPAAGVWRRPLSASSSLGRWTR